MPGDDEVAVRATRITGPGPDHFAPVPDDLHPDPTPSSQRFQPPPGLRFLGPRARAWWTRNQHGLLIALVGTIGLRVVSEWIGLVSQYGVNFPHEVARRPSLLSEVWGHWDAVHYLSIAQYGYAGKAVGHGQALGDIAFAPLYPAGIRLVHAVTPFNWEASAELLSADRAFRVPDRAPPSGRHPRRSGRRCGVDHDAPGVSDGILPPGPLPGVAVPSTGDLGAAQRRVRPLAPGRRAGSGRDDDEVLLDHPRRRPLRRGVAQAVDRPPGGLATWMGRVQPPPT